MSFALRFAAVALALCLSSQSAFANVIRADASLADAAILIDEDAASAPHDAATADAAASTDEMDSATTADPTMVANDGSASVIQIPNGTSGQFSAPNFEGDDGCASTGASTGSFSTVAVGLFAMLALAWSRRRR